MPLHVLTYHAARIEGPHYAANDQVAFASDLEHLQAWGCDIVPLDDVLAHWEAGTDNGRVRVALTCDDAPVYDAHPHVHPQWGRQPGLLPSLQAFRRAHGPGLQPGLELTAFAIADPVSRAHLGAQLLGDAQALDDRWWEAAESSGLFRVEHHSWDHNHACLPEGAGGRVARGSFDVIATPALAQVQIEAAQDWFVRRLGRARRHFAYPYGHAPEFLTDQWLPTHGPRLGLRAAWTTAGVAVESHHSRWALPRSVCGWHWTTPEGLRRHLGLVSP